MIANLYYYVILPVRAKLRFCTITRFGIVKQLPIYYILVLFGRPPSYAVPLTYAVFRGFFFHPKNRVIEGEYCISKHGLIVCLFNGAG